MTRLLKRIPLHFASPSNERLASAQYTKKRTAATMYLTICNHRAATLLNWRVRRSSRGRTTIRQADKTTNTNTRLIQIPSNYLCAQAAEMGVVLSTVSYLLENARWLVVRNVHVYLHVLVSNHKGNQSTSMFPKTKTDTRCKNLIDPAAAAAQLDVRLSSHEQWSCCFFASD